MTFLFIKLYGDFMDIYIFIFYTFVLESVLSHLSIATPTFGEGNGTPLQYSCLENPMDGGAW